MPNQMMNLVERMIKEQVRLKEAQESAAGENCQSGDLSLSIWDFAGHDVYYTTHQVRSNYEASLSELLLLSFNLRKQG